MKTRALLQPVILPAYATGAARIAARALRGHVRHLGTAATILPAVVERCWDGRRYAASGGQFRQFWARDFGFAAPALVRLGHGARVDASLDWALAAWSRAGRVTTTIFPGARPADIWDYGVDSLPFVLRALRAAPSGERLVARHADLLGAEVRRFAAEVLDPATGLVRADRRFSTHRDTVATSGDRFGEGPRGTPEHDLVTGDGNVVPFWLGVAPDDLGAGAMLGAVAAAGLTDPLPLRYSAAPSISEDAVQRVFVPDYQGTAIWTSLGAMATEVALRVDLPRGEGWLREHLAVIERDGTMWEVLDLLRRFPRPAAPR
jgi:hypothetical protein